MPQLLQGVVEVSNPRDHIICYRVTLAQRFHYARCDRIAVPIRKSKILTPESSSPLLRNLLDVLDDFTDIIAGDMPLSYKLLRVELTNPQQRIEIIKRSLKACKVSDMVPTIRDRRSMRLVA